MKLFMEKTADKDIVKVYTKMQVKTIYLGKVTKNGKKHFYSPALGMQLGHQSLVAVLGLVKKLNNQVKKIQDAAAAV